MITILKKKRTYVIAVILCLVGFAVYWAYPLVQYNRHNLKEYYKIPSDLCIKLQFVFNDGGHFCVPFTIDDKPRYLIVDTKSTCCIKKEDIEKHRGIYFGKLSLPTTNSINQKYKKRLYTFPNSRIDTFLTTPLFSAVDKDNYTYHLMNEGILGTNMLRLCNWKFSVDDNSVEAYSGKNKNIDEKSHGFIKIKNGLRDDNISLMVGASGKEAKFTLDLGNNVEVLVNNEKASELKKQYPYKTILSLREDDGREEFLLFENISLLWNGIRIPDCQIINVPSFPFDQNFIGAGLMHRFNFILEYDSREIGKNNLYIKPCKTFEQFKSQPFISSFGMNITERNHRFIVYNIEQGGIAEKAGIELGDEVLGVDSCELNPKETKKKFIRYAQEKKEISIRIKDKGEIRLSMDNHAKP